MRILVTGASGYIANNLIPKLIEQGHDVISTSRTRPKRIQGTWIKYAINEPPKENLFELFEKPDILIHCAWSGIPNYTDFSQLENFLPNYHFIKNLVDNGLKDVTILGTCLEYGKYEGEAVETMVGQDLTYYAEAKVRLYNAVSRLSINLKWLRLFYNYGEGSIFYSLCKYKQGEVDIVDNNQYRDYLPINDVVENIIKSATQTKVNGIINVCSALPIQVTKLATYINPNIKLNIGKYENKSFEGARFWGNCDKLNSVS